MHCTFVVVNKLRKLTDADARNHGKGTWFKIQGRPWGTWTNYNSIDEWVKAQATDLQKGKGKVWETVREAKLEGSDDIWHDKDVEDRLRDENFRRVVVRKSGKTFMKLTVVHACTSPLVQRGLQACKVVGTEKRCP